MKIFGMAAKRERLSLVGIALVASIGTSAVAENKPPGKIFLEKPGLFKSITNPPCSYCIVQHRKGLIEQDDHVVAWLRSKHNGGSIQPGGSPKQSERHKHD